MTADYIQSRHREVENKVARPHDDVGVCIEKGNWIMQYFMGIVQFFPTKRLLRLEVER